MSEVPVEIVAAVNGLLAPYGVHYTSADGGIKTRGYLSTRGACDYLGISRTFLYGLVRKKLIHPIKLNDGAENGKVVYEIADLESYVATCRIR